MIYQKEKVLKDFIIKHKNEIFHRRSPHIWVEGLVVFARPDVELSINNPTVGVLRVDELCGFIEKHKGKAKFSEDELERMGEVILRYSG